MIEKGIREGFKFEYSTNLLPDFSGKKFEYESRAHMDSIPNEVEAENPVLLSLYPT